MRSSLPLRLLALAALPLALVACDSTTDNDDGDLGNEIYVETFEINGTDLDINTDASAATYVREVDELTTRVIEDGVVLVFADGELIGDNRIETWTPLPFTQAVDIDDDVDVDFTIEYTYTYERDFVYLDFLSTATGTTFEDFASTEFRLVVIPGASGLRPSVDYSDYAALAAAYGLPD